VLDASTGDVVASFQQPRGGRVVFMNGFVWESADTVAAVALEGSMATILRFGVDGSLEQTVDLLDANRYGDVPYWLGEDRRRTF
jgi:hypothetical protein